LKDNKNVVECLGDNPTKKVGMSNPFGGFGRLWQRWHRGESFPQKQKLGVEYGMLNRHCQAKN
jgi:hypothetical protein